MKKALFLDRDGTIISEVDDYMIDSFEKLSFLPNAIQNLAKIARELDFDLVMITNQDGLGTEVFPEEKFWPVHNHIIKILKDESIVFKDVFIDETYPEDNAPTRKPGTALLTAYMKGDYDLSQSFVVGDRLTDMELAQNLGAKGIWINDGSNLGDEEVKADRAGLNEAIVLDTMSWDEIFAFLKLGGRKVQVTRNTKETQIDIELDLDGSGQAKVTTGLGFFDHMLEQIARHAQVDLTINTIGDLHIDEHHTIEDTALALGEAFRKALGSKLGLARYGFCLPMDESLAQVAIDFGGRPWLVWEADFKREKVGDMPTEMFMHFFKSFSDAAQCNLNMKVEGENEHHKIESLFKAFAKSIYMAKQRNADSAALPSTKGML